MSRSTKTKPANLTINATKSNEDDRLPPPSPMMNLEGIDLSSFGGEFNSSILNLNPLPQSPPTSPRIPQESSPRLFKPAMKSRTTSELDQRAEPPPRRPIKDEEEYRPNSSSVSKIYHLRKNPGSTPELSLVGSADNVRKQSDDVTTQTTESGLQPASYSQDDTSSTKRKEKTFRNPLARTKSIRRDSNSKTKPSKQSLEPPPKTAPLQSEFHGSSELLLAARSKEKRGKSAERAVASEGEDNVPLDRAPAKDKDRSGFLTGSKNAMNKAKTGGGHLLNRLGKIGRTNSHHDREIPDSEYVLHVINQPLIDQTRITRISKDLGSCRDKTEYWMPSLPWRCIDYLNLNCESEGLYRVPGSGPQVKLWQRRFDTELDLDLLDEKELYDPNIISSMLKSWLRDLPTEIFPKTQQLELGEKLQKENPNYQKIGEPVPQKLRDALSELPPFNYYLLFAITCHLSLLLSHKDRNKMDLNNLSICIGPCLDLERWLFNYLVGEWRHCWQGCFTEKQYLEAEKRHEQGLDNDPSSSSAIVDDSSASRQGSKDEDVRTITRKEVSTAPSRRNENLKPDPSIASFPDYSHYVNGAVLTPERKPVTIPEIQRPSTAQGDKQGNDSAAATPRPTLSSHSRSQSDVPMSPPAQQAPSPMTFPFKVRNE